MAELFVPHDESLMPLVMGSPYRVPDYAYPNWGLPPHTVERYPEGLQEAGFVLDSPLIRQLVDYSVIHANPHQVLSNSNLLQVCIGQKPA